MSFRTVETVFGYSDGRPGLRSRFSGCSDAIAPALRNELLLEVGDSTVGMEYEFAGGGCSIEVFFEGNCSPDFGVPAIRGLSRFP